MAEHPDRRVASPREPESSWAFIYTAANPDELHQREGARRSPWHFPFLHRCKNLTPILETHLPLNF